MRKKLVGFDPKMKKWRDDIFGFGFGAGAEARVAAGIPSPRGRVPKTAPAVPAEYFGRSLRALWARGWKYGYAIGTPDSRDGKKRIRKRELTWKRDLNKRGPLRVKSAYLVGRWRTARGEYAKVWNLAGNGALTGRVTKSTSVIADAKGTWKVEDDCLVFDYKDDFYGGEMGAPYEVRSVIMAVTRNQLVVATGETARVRYSRTSRHS